LIHFLASTTGSPCAEAAIESADPLHEAEDPMEICILKFDGSHEAEDDLKEQIEAQGDRNPWLYDVGTIARPLVGRVRIGATFPDGNSATFHEGDLTKAAGELGAYTGYYLAQLPGVHATRVGGAARGGSAGKSVGSTVESELFRIDAIKEALPRDSSALVLIADTKLCDAMVETFKSYDPQVVRRDVGDELRKRLQTYQDQVAQAFVETAAPH
jgi:uncharacterized membrane protein